MRSDLAAGDRAFALTAGLTVLYAVGKLESAYKSKSVPPAELKTAHGKDWNRQPKS
ncbi:hypothetical protein [Pararhizobium sp. LjRoot255]|uniref:hypothetical protein n=1 Tax=Pararhizobium sp. LjRoot255 TaxID=3342298 RepID=UPI003F50D33A